MRRTAVASGGVGDAAVASGGVSRAPRYRPSEVGIQAKLLGVLSVPLLVLVLVAALVSVQAFSEARRAGNVKTLATSASTFGRLISHLQAERALSVRSIGTSHQAIRSAAQLPAVHASVDGDLAATATLIADIDFTVLSAETRFAVAAIPKTREALRDARVAVSEGKSNRNAIGVAYSVIIANKLQILMRLAHSLADRNLGQRIKAFTDLGAAAEMAVRERDLGLVVIAAGTGTAGQSADLVRLATWQDASLAAFRYDAAKAQQDLLATELTSDLLIRDVFPRARAQFSAVGKAGVGSLAVSRWQLSADERIDAMNKVAASVAGDTAAAAAAVARDASRKAAGVLALAAALLLLSIALGLLLSRAITRPLKLLTAIAGQVREVLPRMVEQIATPGCEPAIAFPDIPFSSSDEVGQLAAAFRAVNETTVQVAREQAALRASIAEMFVNVARRNQVLLSRQLSFIDQLERSEENPAVLDDLLKLDHLATRMRRNAESLIVLAGIESGRRMRQPMPLADVVRTAVTEIEHYDRVDLSFGTDVSVLGRFALTAGHLLAEVLENATQFSAPTTRVLVSTVRTTSGVRVVVVDEGMGMSDAELADANQRIASPPVSELLGSKRLGLYVVGRLARQLEATVDLRAGNARGVVVVVELPLTMLVAEGPALASDPEPRAVVMPVIMPVAAEGQRSLVRSRRAP